MQTLGIEAVQEFVTSHLRDVFETMFSMNISPEPGNTPADGAEHITGVVGFGGESVTGAAYLHLPAKFAGLLSSYLLSISADDLGDSEVNDAVGEITNMLTGGLKSWLCDNGAECAVSTPGIIRGNSFAVEPPPDIDRLQLGFGAGPNHFKIEIHIKFQ